MREPVRYHDNLKRTPLPKPGRREPPLSINDLLVEVNEFLAGQRGYDVFAESGDMLFGGLEIRQPRGGLYFAQGYYASMGFAVPAALGAQIGTGRRPLVLCGDGGFQMTGAEISYAPMRGLSPIVVLVNNAGWGIFRPVTPRKDLLRIPPWPYAELAQAWGGVGIGAHTRRELREALRAAHEVRDFVIIECHGPAGRHLPGVAALHPRERPQEPRCSRVAAPQAPMRTRGPSDAMLVALPLAAGFTVQLASWLPIRFAYRENPLGIVSLATLQRYPLQQETFWLVFAALALALLAWALSRALRPAGVPPGTQATALAFAVLGLVLALWLPGAAGALGLRRGGRCRDRPGPARESARAARRRADHARALATSTGRRLILVAVAVLVSLPLTSGIWLSRLERRLRHARRPARRR